MRVDPTEERAHPATLAWRPMTAIAAFGAVVVLATSCSPTAGAETIVDEGCDDVIVIAARGSGQPDGVGDQNQAVIDRLVRSGTLDRNLIEPVPYPAPALRDDPTAWLEGRYEESVDAGAGATVDAVERRIAECEDADIVLLGYSQGAQVIEGAIGLLAEADHERIAAVVLMASPRHDPARGDITYVGGDAAATGGMLGHWEPPPWVRDRLIAVCDPHDFICSGTLGFTHSRAYLDPELAEEVAAAIAATLQS